MVEIGHASSATMEADVEMYSAQIGGFVFKIKGKKDRKKRYLSKLRFMGLEMVAFFVIALIMASK
jgi:nitrate/nitrite-specific signal transduction histidine kinase